MFIYVQKAGKYRYVSLRESYINEEGKTRSRTVQNLGRLDLLEAEDPQVLEKLKAKYNGTENPRTQKANELAQNSLKALSEQGPQKADEDTSYPMLRYGLFPLLRIWDDDLGMSGFLDYLTRHYSKIEFDLSRYITYLTLKRLIEPQSVMGSMAACIFYLGHWLKDCKLDELYRSYDFLCEHHDEIMSHVNRRLSKLEPHGPATMIFYDVTNVYFETSLTDEEKCYTRPGAFEYLFDLLQKASHNHEFNPEDILPLQKRLLNGEPPEMLLPEVIVLLSPERRQELKENLFLRLRGPSKEHRTDLPLVSVALTIDEQGYPLDFSLYPGCSSEMRTMKESILAVKRKYQVEDVIVVADRGLNSYDNLKMLLEEDLGFLVAQKVTEFDGATEKLICDPEGYTEITDHESGELRCKYKAIRDWHRTGPRGQSVKCTLVCSFSPAREARDLKQLELDEKRARQAVEQHQQMKGSRRSWQQLVVLQGEQPTAARFNTKALERRRRLCGYSAVIYEPRPGSERVLTPGEINSSYHRLERIEECFRLLKHNLDLRPMYVWSESRIHGHIMVCVLALLVWRLLERRLEQQDQYLSPDSVRHALFMAHVQPSEHLVEQQPCFSYAHCYEPNQILINQQILSSYRKALCIDDIAGMMASDSERHIDAIMRCCGLTPLPQVSSRKKLCQCLGRRYNSDEELLGLHYRQEHPAREGSQSSQAPV